MVCFQESVCVVLIGSCGKEALAFTLKSKEGPSGRPFTRIQTSLREECWFHGLVMGNLFSFLSFFLLLPFFFLFCYLFDPPTLSLPSSSFPPFLPVFLPSFLSSFLPSVLGDLLHTLGILSK